MQQRRRNPGDDPQRRLTRKELQDLGSSWRRDERVGELVQEQPQKASRYGSVWAWGGGEDKLALMVNGEVISMRSNGYEWTFVGLGVNVKQVKSWNEENVSVASDRTPRRGYLSIPFTHNVICLSRYFCSMYSNRITITLSTVPWVLISIKCQNKIVVA